MTLDGHLISADMPELNRVRQRVGMVFQSFNLFPHMTVIDNVTLAPRKVLGIPKSEARAAGMALLERFGLAEKAGEYPDRLSGGQQQRVATHPGTGVTATGAAARRSNLGARSGDGR
ncbi:MAG: ATP-binding cassette domain-containing protein [Thermomicrobiales bacterium]